MAPPLHPDARIGTAVGGYVISRLIGQGGMGAVYEARHGTLDLRAAIKIPLHRVSPQLGQTALLDRLLNEARVLSSVHSSGLVKIYDCGTLPDGTLYILMELLDGETLSERLHRLGRIPETVALQLTQQIARAMSAVHGKGIIHRDLTPSNVFLVANNRESPDSGEQEQAKILDFGLAKLRQSMAAVTQPGERFGTPRYMSPEHCEGLGEVDDRTDVYTLGLVLFEMVTGESPYALTAGDPLQWMYAHIHHAPRPLRQLAPSAPLALEQLVERMLDKSPGLRPSMSEVSELIERVQQGLPLTGIDSQSAPAPLQRADLRTSSQPGRMRKRGLRALVLSALLVAGGGAFVLKRPRTAAQARVPAGMVLVPGAVFTMGSEPAQVEQAHRDCLRVPKDECPREFFEREQPARHVKVPSFAMDRFEVTNEAYAAWLNAPVQRTEVQNERLVYSEGTLLLDMHPEVGGIEHAAGRFAARRGAERLPVVQVSWYGARQFCLSNGKDLPTEAQWELSAHGADPQSHPTPWPWGEGEPRCDGVRFGRFRDAPCAHAGGNLAEVGTSQQDVTPHGIQDLGGNAREWTLDAFMERYPDCGDCVDPIVLPAAPTQPSVRVVRGGNWIQTPVASRSASRYQRQDIYVSTGIGFRCALRL